MPGELLYRLSKNKALEEVGEHIKSTPVNWEQIVEVVNDLDVSVNVFSNEGSLAGLLSEIHLKLLLGQLAQDIKIKTQPIPEETRVGTLRFHRTITDGYRVWNLARRIDQVEYDQILTADELPVIMEAKMGTDKKSLDAALTNKRINQLLLPMEMFFRTGHYGYMVVVAQEAIDGDDRMQASFARKGGLIVPFSQTKQQFLDGLQEVKPRIQRGSRVWSFGN